MENIEIKQITEMIKVRSDADIQVEELKSLMGLKGETQYYQIAISTKKKYDIIVQYQTDLENALTCYLVKNVVMDYPVHLETDEDVLTCEPGLI